jgi:hypothetical protein
MNGASIDGRQIKVSEAKPGFRRRRRRDNAGGYGRRY